jgi:hypothetical protein
MTINQIRNLIGEDWFTLTELNSAMYGHIDADTIQLVNNTKHFERNGKKFKLIKEFEANNG